MKELNQRGPKFLVEWSCTKERINEKGPYILIKWSGANKDNKPERTQIFGRMVLHKRKNK